MSVSLLDVLENAGYDVRNNVSDARWLMSQYDDFMALHESSENLVDKYSDYEDFISMQEELGVSDVPSFEEWRNS